eukprot:4666179-Amphidinium_carterae.1
MSRNIEEQQQQALHKFLPRLAPLVWEGRDLACTLSRPTSFNARMQLMAGTALGKSHLAQGSVPPARNPPYLLTRQHQTN